MEEVMRMMKEWCSTCEVCILEAKTRMRKWNINEADSDNIVETLIKLGYIDEERYTRAFVNDKLTIDKWGPQKVRMVLKQHGINETLIAKAIAEKNVNQEAVIAELLSKKIKSFKKLAGNEIYAKLMRFGLSRGFDYVFVAKYASQYSKMSEVSESEIQETEQ
jgi:regulatory protein